MFSMLLHHSLAFFNRVIKKINRKKQSEISREKQLAISAARAGAGSVDRRNFIGRLQLLPLNADP